MRYRLNRQKIVALLICAFFAFNSSLAFARVMMVSEPISPNIECPHDTKSRGAIKHSAPNINLCCYSIVGVFDFDDLKGQEIAFDKQIAFKPPMYRYYHILDIYRPPKQYS